MDASTFEAQSVISEGPVVFQFQVMVDAINPNRFYFYEVLQDEAATQIRKDTDVYKDWWNTVHPMLEGDMDTIANLRTLFPTGKGLKEQKPGLLQW